MFFNTKCGFPFTILPFKNYAKELKKKGKRNNIYIQMTLGLESLYTI